MTQYEKLTEKQKHCEQLAELLQDPHLKTFYKNAAKGYEIKRGRLSVEEAAR